MTPDGMILVGEQTRVDRTQRNQAVGDNRYHDMPLDSVIGNRNHLIRCMQASGDAGNPAHRENHDAQALDTSKNTTEQNLNRNQPANQRKGDKQSEVESLRLIDQITQRGCL